MKCVQFNSNIIKLSIFILFFSFSGGCTKEDINVVPYNQVNLQLDMTSELAGLRGAGIVVTVIPDLVKGYRWGIIDYHDSTKNHPQDTRFSRQVGVVQNNGIILYHSVYGEYAEYGEWLAFDLTCPYQAFVPKPDGDCALIVDGRLSLPICPCCKSVFNLENGVVAASCNHICLNALAYVFYVVYLVQTCQRCVKGKFG